jgi:hypothetical protein
MYPQSPPQAADVVGDQRCHECQQCKPENEHWDGVAALRFRGTFRDAVPIRGGDEAVPVAGQSFNELGILARVAQCLPEFLDGVVQTVVELDECVCGPQAGTQILPRDHLSGMFN